MLGNRKVMTYLLRLITLLPLISACVTAQTKVQVCFKYQPVPIAKNCPFCLLSEELPLHLNGHKWVRRYPIDMTHIVLPPEFRVHDSTMPDAGEVNMLLPFHGESFLRCQIVDIYPNGSTRIH